MLICSILGVIGIVCCCLSVSTADFYVADPNGFPASVWWLLGTGILLILPCAICFFKGDFTDDYQV
jgi:hypothetical protein